MKTQTTIKCHNEECDEPAILRIQKVEHRPYSEIEVYMRKGRWEELVDSENDSDGDYSATHFCKECWYKSYREIDINPEHFERAKPLMRDVPDEKKMRKDFEELFPQVKTVTE